jgi:membrane protein YqaA with SNARE-associated domain
MQRFVTWVQGFALSLGGPGLFIIAFLDSSFLSFPEVCDLLIVWLTVQHEERMLFYALMCTLGSVAGCFALYSVGRRGGEAFLRKRFKAGHLERAMGIFRKFGLLAIIVPSLLPPPMPFKIFVLAAGVAKVRRLDFLVAVSIGRGVRYFGEGFLALWYGEAAIGFLRENARIAGLVLAVLILVGGVGWYWWRRRRPAPSGSGRRGETGEGEKGRI